MEPIKRIAREYWKTLEERARDARVSHPHQLIGLEIAEILRDDRHRALYIKLAKLHDGEWLLGLAKRIRENNTVKRKGAYFMRLVANQWTQKKQPPKTQP